MRRFLINIGLRSFKNYLINGCVSDAKTLTCYEGIIGDGCGKCPACQLRRQGYEKYMQMKANVSTAI